MPTPMPIIEARIGVVVGTSTTAATRVSSITLIPSPKRAMPMGRPMARIEPKASRRMSTAASRPISSAPWVSGCSTNWGSSPPTSIWMPWSANGSPTASRASRSVDVEVGELDAVLHLGQGRRCRPGWAGSWGRSPTRRRGSSPDLGDDRGDRGGSLAVEDAAVVGVEHQLGRACPTPWGSAPAGGPWPAGTRPRGPGRCRCTRRRPGRRRHRGRSGWRARGEGPGGGG